MNWKLLGPNAPETQKILASEQPFIPMSTPTPGAVKASEHVAIDLLRSQLADARKQLEVDSQTIAKLAKDKRELSDSLSRVIDSPNSIVSAGLFAEASLILSRHA